jgi:GNAT superfamily N-acetyltransferase
MTSIKYSVAKSTDVPGLVAFLTNTFKMKSPEFWTKRLSLIWDENPAFNKNDPRGILAKHDDKIVGFIAWFPVMLQFRGEETASSNAAGLAVHHDFRRRGIATALRKRHLDISRDTFVFATTPGNPITLRINQKYGFKLLPNNVDYKRYFYSIFIIDSKDWLKLRYVSHLAKALPFCRKVMCFLLDRYQSIRLRTFRKRLSQGRDLMVKEVREAHASFDVLWEETKHYQMITNVRSSEVINWYLNPKNSERKRLYACYRKKKLIGYMIFVEREIRGIKALFCADVWYKRGEGWSLEKILYFAVCRAAKMAYGAVVLPEYNKELSTRFRMMGLARIRYAKRDEFYLAPAWMERSIDEDNSYFVYLNGDRGR